MVIFKEETHQYFNTNGKELISVTTLMQKHGLSPSYDAVPSEVLNAKAQRGSFIHKEIEEYIKEGKIGFTKELTEFINKQKGEVLVSEGILYNDIVAGTCDLVLYDNGYIIGDIKTTYTLHKEAVSWQLSIYAYLLHYQNPSITVTRGQAYHFDKDGNLNIVEIPLKPVKEVERLLDAERKGILYTQTLAVKDAELMQLYEVEALIKNFEEQKKQAEAQAKEIRAAILKAMEQNGIKTFENERIRITYTPPTTKKQVDNDKLKAAGLYDEYLKETNVKAKITITLKEAKE